VSARTDRDGPAAATGIAIGFVIGGWVLYAMLAPVAVFLTWWGDCIEVDCAIPGVLDQAAYAFDLAFWLVLPVLAYFAYQGRRTAWMALLACSIVLDLQFAAAVVGSRGFSGFALTLPPAAMLTFGSALGLAMATPRFRDRPGASSAGEVAAIGCLGLIVAVVALQGFLVGIGGPLIGVGIVMAVALFVIAIAAYAQRGRGTTAGRRGRR
jgi:hypothetical protein